MTGSSFTAQTWGTGSGGFNHNGPAGFQIRDAPLPATITSFGTNVVGSSAVIGLPVEGVATIDWTVPYGTDLVTLAPTFTLSSGTCDPTSGATPVPGFDAGPATYTVTDATTLPDPTTTVYTVTATWGPASTDCDLTSFGTNVAGTAAVITTTSPTTGTVDWYVPSGTVVGSLAPAYTVSALATGDPASETSLDFTSPQTYTVTAQDGTTTKTYDVTVTVANALVWNVAGGGDWDLATTPNWNLPDTTATTFATGDEVTFNKTEGGTIAIASGMSPLSTTVSATAGTYTFSGGPIALGSLTKSGGGQLTISGTAANHSYSGGTVINGGTLYMYDVQSSTGLGTGPVTLNGGVFHLDRFICTNSVIVNGGSLILNNGFSSPITGPITLNAPNLNITAYYANHPLSGAISGPGGFTLSSVAGGGLTLSGTNSYEGPTTVTGGTLNCNNANALGSGALSISTGGAKVNLNYVGTKTVASLTLGGVAQTIPGTYGSVASGADVQNDTYFAGAGTVTVLPSATISVFGTNVIGSSAVISPVVANVATIAWTVPFGTVLANLAPEFTMSYGATCDRTSGAIPSPNFSAGPVVYTVTSSDSLITNAYTVTVTVTPVSTAKVMSNVYFAGHGYAWASDGTGFNLLMVVPSTTDVSAMAPTFSVSQFATCSPTSGTSRNFTTPQTYTVTAQDGSTQNYIVTVQKITATGSGSYQQKVLASGPVSYWPLNETSGTTAFDLATGLNNITYGGTYTLGDAGLRTDGNPSVLFTTATGTAYTGVAINPSLNPLQFSVECWVKPVDSTVQYLVSLQDRTTGGRWGYAIWKNNGGPGFGMQWGTQGASTGSINATTAAVPGNAYHVVGTYDGSTFKLYVNGVLEASLPSIYQPASATQPGFSIGSRNGVTPAPSNIQDVALYTRALTQAEIQNHYQSTIPYSTWAATYAGGQTPGEDYNNDGVQNGIAYFMGATGLATNPGLNAGGTVTWPLSATFSGTYEVQTSPDLGTWTNVTPKPLPAGGNLSYTLPPGLGKQFVRLLVTPAP